MEMLALAIVTRSDLRRIVKVAVVDLSPLAPVKVLPYVQLDARSRHVPEPAAVVPGALNAMPEVMTTSSSYLAASVPFNDVSHWPAMTPTML